MSDIKITWEFVPKSFRIETSKDGFHWSGCVSQEYNDSWEFQQSLKGQKASKVRIVMYEADPKKGTYEGHSVYGIQNVSLNARNLRPVAEKCAKAAHSPDARDKWFLVEVSEFNPCHNPKLDQPPGDTPVTTKYEGQPSVSMA